MKYALLLIINLLAVTCLAACGSSENISPEQEVKITLKQIEAGVEARSLSQVMEKVSENYQDHYDNNKRAVARLMQFQIMRNQNINVFTLIKSINIVGNTASVELSAAMASKEVDLSIESNRLRADAYRFSVSLAKEEGLWLIQSASWERGW